jgi:hypothetical protein
MARRRGAYRVLPGKPKGKRPFGTPRRRWRIILKWMEGSVDCIDLAQDKDR